LRYNVARGDRAIPAVFNWSTISTQAGSTGALATAKNCCWLNTALPADILRKLPVKVR
jgi:hypothetical protein